MRPISCIIKEIRSDAPLIRTFRLDKKLDPTPGQYLMLWIRGLDEIPMSFSGPEWRQVTDRIFANLQAGKKTGQNGPGGHGHTKQHNSDPKRSGLSPGHEALDRSQSGRGGVADANQIDRDQHQQARERPGV